MNLKEAQTRAERTMQIYEEMDEIKVSAQFHHRIAAQLNASGEGISPLRLWFASGALAFILVLNFWAFSFVFRNNQQPKGQDQAMTQLVQDFHIQPTIGFESGSWEEK